MRVLCIGVGGVGEAIARIAKDRDFVTLLVLADYNLARATEVQAKLGNNERFPVEKIDARKQADIEALAKKYGVEMIINSCDPSFNEPIFEAAFNVGAKYMDMALTLSEPHDTKPFEEAHIKLGDYQFERASKWEAAGNLALVGMGVEPGMSNVFARYAASHLGLAEIDEIGVRDGSNIVVDGYAFAPNFSVWTVLEECLNPPIVYDHGKIVCTEPFSEPEVFDFPGGIGPCEVVNVEHEEVVMISRFIPSAKRVTFKFGLGTDFINVLKTIKMLGLSSKEPIQVKGVTVTPRDVVAAVLPDPAKIGHLMHGKTCAGVWVKGRTAAGEAKEHYIYQVADNDECMAKLGVQAVVAQTAFNVVIALELLAAGVWKGAGVLGPECFDPLPFMDRMAGYGFPWGIMDVKPRAA